MRNQDLAVRVTRLEHQVAALERRMSSVEATITERLDQMGGYKSRTDAELLEIRAELAAHEAMLESLIQLAQDEQDRARARALLRRVRNNQTRANNALRG